MAEYDIHQVTRYVLVRKVPGGFSDMGEFKRRDDAEAVLRTVNGVQHQLIDAGTTYKLTVGNKPVGTPIGSPIGSPLSGF